MHTLTIEVTDEHALEALHNLEEKKFIRIIDGIDLNSPALSGNQLSLAEFRSWISDAEKTDTISLNDVINEWESKKKKLR